MDTDRLFEKYTIDEIRDIERKTRQDIERKKEDLRVMVGERYRDLIEAADTIGEMKTSSDKVMTSLSSMQQLCQQMKMSQQRRLLTTPRQRHDSFRVKPENQFYSMAVQVKLLLDMPEKIWSAVDGGDYLWAVRLFLLARHTHTGLQLDASMAAHIQSCLPLLGRQWAGISHFRSTLLEACKHTLTKPDISDKMAAECLCSILLLEDSTPADVFENFLQARTNAIRSVFSADTTVKTQVTQAVSLLVTTLQQIHTVFSHSESADLGLQTDLLMTALAKATNHGPEGSIVDDGQVSVMSYLPSIISGFRPALKKPALPISQHDIYTMSADWIKKCVTEIENGLRYVLGFLTSIKGLASIRDEVWILLAQDPRMTNFDAVCELILKKHLSIWNEFFSPLFLARVKELVGAKLARAQDGNKEQMATVLTGLSDLGSRSNVVERDLPSYVWKEEGSDLPLGVAWVPQANKSIADSGGLLMKVHGYTPAVQSLCRSFDTHLKALLEDASYYMRETSTPDKQLQPSEPPFDRFADKDSIHKFIQESSIDSINKLIKHMDSNLYASKQQLKHSTDSAGNTLIIDRVLLLGRMAGALCELSPHLQQCVNTDRESPTRNLGKKSHYGRQQPKISENPHWHEVKSKLRSFLQQCFDMCNTGCCSVWGEQTTQHLVKELSQQIQDSSPSSVLSATTRWDEIQIEEETEEGETVKSKIRIPMQASWYIQAMLCHLCIEVNRIGGQAVSRTSLQRLVEKLTDGMVDSFEDCVKQNTKDVLCVPLTQNRALQLLFNLRYTTQLLTRREENQANTQYQLRVQRVQDRLEACVDPFDLDVFSPYLQSHLTRQVHRASVMYGFLTSLDRHGGYGTTRAPPSSHQEQHNVLPLSTQNNRFALLPLSIQNQSNVSQPILQPPKPKAHPLSSALPTSGALSIGGQASLPQQPVDQPTSFLGQMSTMWFSNVTSKAK